jgi:hypothetical protein
VRRGVTSEVVKLLRGPESSPYIRGVLLTRRLDKGKILFTEGAYYVSIFIVWEESCGGGNGVT